MITIADRLKAKQAARDAELNSNKVAAISNVETATIANTATSTTAEILLHDKIFLAARAEDSAKIAEKLKAVYLEQLLKEGEEVKAIDLVDHSLYPSGYIPVDAIAEKQKEVADIKAVVKAETAIKAASTMMEKIAAARAKQKLEAEVAKQVEEELEEEIKHHDNEPEAIQGHTIHHQSEGSNQSQNQDISEVEGDKSREVHQNGSIESNVSIDSGRSSAERAFDARDLIHRHIEAEKKKLSFAELMALKKQTQLDAALTVEPERVLDSSYQEDPKAITKAFDEEIEEAEVDPNAVEEYQGAFALNIPLNEKQLLAKEMALSGKSFCLIGAAGTGKTTTQRSVAETLLSDKRLTTTKFKLSGTRTYVDAPSFAAVAYTRRASANLQRAIHKNPELEAALRFNIMTIHALLEFEPEYFWDDEKQKESMRFAPQRTAKNPLTITHLVIEEASMLGLDLWEMLYDALPLGVQIIFIGDINQLPPVFGASILNYALLQVPVLELTHVYRQKGDSLVLANAHHILKGEKLEEGTGFTIVRGKNEQQVGQERMSMTLGSMFKQYEELGFYDHEQDMILSPFNKQALGTDNMNKWISQFLSEKREAVVFEVIAGFNKLYVAEGDKVMYNKQDAFITSIKHNPMYHGKEPQMPGRDLSRFGVRVLKDGAGASNDLDDLILNYENFSIEELAESTGERKMQCSHVVSIETETGQKIDLAAAGDFAPAVFSLGYVLTVHKAQGCEWRKVFIILHKDHSMMLTRELFYTAVTRAREEVIVIAKDYIIDKAIKTQRIKGNTLADKIEYFNSGALDIGDVSCTK